MTESQMSFRSLSITDIDEIVALERLSFSRPWGRESYTHELTENQLAYYFGIFGEGELIAFGGYWLIVDEGHIANIAVHPAYRRQGVGELLIRRIMPEFMAQGGKWMTLEVRQHNLAAQNLYKKLGFKLAGVRPGYYDDPKDDAAIMWLHMRSIGKEGNKFLKLFKREKNSLSE